MFGGDLAFRTVNIIDDPRRKTSKIYRPDTKNFTDGRTDGRIKISFKLVLSIKFCRKDFNSPRISRFVIKDAY